MYYQYSYTDIAYITWLICNTSSYEFDNYNHPITDDKDGELYNCINSILNPKRFRRMYTEDKETYYEEGLVDEDGLFDENDSYYEYYEGIDDNEEKELYAERTIKDIKIEISKHINEWDKIFHFTRKQIEKSIFLSRLDAFTVVFLLLYPTKQNSTLARIIRTSSLNSVDSGELYDFCNELSLFLTLFTVHADYIWDKAVENNPSNGKKRREGGDLLPFKPVTVQDINMYVQPLRELVAVFDGIDSIERKVAELKKENLFALSLEELSRIKQQLDELKIPLIDD